MCVSVCRLVFGAQCGLCFQALLCKQKRQGPLGTRGWRQNVILRNHSIPKAELEFKSEIRDDPCNKIPCVKAHYYFMGILLNKNDVRPPGIISLWSVSLSTLSIRIKKSFSRIKNFTKSFYSLRWLFTCQQKYLISASLRYRSFWMPRVWSLEQSTA